MEQTPEAEKMVTSEDLADQRKKTIEEGIKSCLDIVSSQQHIFNWSQEQLNSKDSLTKEEKEKLEFLIQSSKKNITSLEKQVEDLREVLIQHDEDKLNNNI